MKFNSKNLFTRASLLLLLFHFATFLLYYISTYILYDVQFFTYVWYYVQKSTLLLIPLVSALLVLIADAYLGMKRALIMIIPLSFTKLIFSLPYYYLAFVYDPLYDSTDALLFSLIQSVLESVVLAVFVIVIFFIMRYLISVLNKTDDSRDVILSAKTVLDFKNPVSATFMISSALCFVYIVIDEILTTAAMISQYSGRLTGSEIAYILFSYVFDIILLLLHYFALSCVKNHVIESYVKAEED